MKFGILSIFRKFVEKIQVSLISDTNNEYFTWGPIYIFDDITFKSSYNEESSDKGCTENHNTHFMKMTNAGEISNQWRLPPKS